MHLRRPSKPRVEPLDWAIEKARERMKDVPANAVNVSELDTVLPKLVEIGEARHEGGVYTVDLARMGIDKLLGSGQVRSKIHITVAEATESAKAKITEAGGSIKEPVAEATAA